MEWTFGRYNDHLDIVGFKDNDIEKFGQEAIKSLVREAIQNSCDAIDHRNDNSVVRIKIRLGSIQKDLLPNFSKIEDHLNCCLNDDNDPSENNEIQRHLNAIENSSYTYLEISDYNTTGMDEPAFKSLTQGIFKSKKNITGSQGSKGVGKAAYYACSYLRSMLIVTKNDEGIRFRGASKLSTHKDPENENEKLNYKGFFGGTQIVPIDTIPDVFQRTENGTSVYVIGLWKNNFLRDEIIREVLRNYWFAIHVGQLEFKYEEKYNEICLNKNNLGEYINKYFEEVRDFKTGEKQNPRPYFETVCHGKKYESEIENIGNCNFWIYKNDGFNLGAVARFRKTKMLIYKENNLDPGYAGVFLCDNEEGNKFLKEIENDAHDIWSEKINQDLKEKAKITLKNIKDFINTSFIEYAGIKDSTSFSLDTVDSLFSFSDGKNVTKNKKAKPVLKPLPTETKKDRILEVAKFKSFSANGKFYYKLELESLVTKNNQRFRISIGTDSSKDLINILDSSSGIFKDNILILNVRKGKNLVSKIELDSPYLVAPYLESVN